MGIKNLRKFLDKYAPSSMIDKKYDDYKNKAIAIDTSLVIYKYISAMRKTGKDLTSKSGIVTSHLHGILNLINKLLNHKITPIFVFDGKPPAIKKKTLQKRYEIKKEAEAKLEDKNGTLTMEQKITAFMQATRISPEIIKDTKEMLTVLGIPWVDSVEEADAQCVCLMENKLAYAVATEDMDLLTFGASRVLKDFFATKDEAIVEVNLEKMLKDLKFDQSQFIDLSILLGCDYLPTVEGIGFVRSFDYMTKFGSLDGIFKQVDKPDNYDYQEVRDYFKNATKKCTIPKEEDVKVKTMKNEEIYKLLVDTYDFNIGKYNSFMIARNKFFD
jgi:flap endonuclease-1